MKNFITLFLSLVLVASISFAQKTDILNEGFEGGTIPAGWTQIIEEGSGAEDYWEVQTGGWSGGYYPATAHTGTYNICFGGFPNPSITKIVTPALDLSNGGTLNFWWASHTVNGVGDIDLLTVYYKDGFMGDWVELASYPDGADDWTEATFSLPSSSEIYIAFEGSYDGGTYPVVDDVHVFTSDTDLGIDNVQPVLAFGTETNPTVMVHNYGLIDASSYDVNLTIAGTAYDETVTDGATITPGEEMIIEFPVWTLPAEGDYEITATVTIAGDAVTENNTMTTNCIVDQTPIGNPLGYFDINDVEGNDMNYIHPETDGDNIYVVEWPTSNFAKFTMSGSPSGEFTIGDFDGDDLTYDGQYFYTGAWDGGDGYSTIQKLDLANQTVINTFTSTVSVNSLSYNNNANTFWGGAYSSVFQEFDADGIYTGNQFVAENNVSGTAIDMFTDPENPKIWFFTMEAGAIVEKLIEYDLNTGTATGTEILVNETNFPGIVHVDGNSTDLAGGLACYVNEQNQVILLVGLQKHAEGFYCGRIMSVYLGDAATSYPVTLTVVDEQSAPIQYADVQVGSAKVTGTTDENGQVTFNLIENYYEYAISKDCYLNSYGDFTVSGATPTIDDIILNSVDAPSFTNGVVQTNGQTIELSFNNEMDLNGATAPAGFTVDGEYYDYVVTDIELKSGNNNIVVLTIDEMIQDGEIVTFSYVAGNIQSVCEISLDNITDETLTNNSTILISVNELSGNEFNIYPNPSNGIFIIENSLKNETLEIEITNLTGKTIYNSEVKNIINSEIDLSNQAKGVYFINIKTENGIFTDKLIVQ